MKESGKENLKPTIYDKTLSTAARSPFPNGEGLYGGGFAANIWGDARKVVFKSPVTSP